MQISGISSGTSPTGQSTRTTTSISPATPSRKHFALSGRSVAFDPRVDAARGDLADLRLADRIFAPHYAAAVLRTVARRAFVRTDVGGEPLSEVLPGEPFEVLELARGHAWGVSPVDGAVGFVESDALVPFAPVEDAVPQADFVAVAEALVSAPVTPGGRSEAGVDAGGLVFLALSRAGRPAPRFVDLQAASLGEVVEDGAVQRSDLLFTEASVAIAIDSATAIRAGAERVEHVTLADLGDIVVRRRLA